MLWINPSADCDEVSVHSMTDIDDGFPTALWHHANNAVVNLTLPTSASVDSTHEAEQCNNALPVRPISNISTYSHNDFVLDFYPMNPPHPCALTIQYWNQRNLSNHSNYP